jgi:L-arabinose transport system ATP-binding protein
MPHLEFDNISKAYPGVQALLDISFGVEQGRIHGLMGENGAGKSTLIRILSGDQSADRGTIRLKGHVQQYTSARDAHNAGVTVIHQELQLVPELTVAENLRLGRFPNSYGVIGMKAMFDDVQARLRSAGIDVDAKAKIQSLSIGERQMVEIAKAIISDADVIALDEPTSSLSAHESEILFSLITRLRDAGKVILYISHRLDEVFRLCDGLTVLRDGRLAAHHPVLKGIGRDQIVSEMVGREVKDVFGWRARTIGETRLTVSNVAGMALTSPASFSVRRGEILGFFGLIGSGRSELMRLVYGADQRLSGTVSLDGVAAKTNSPRASIRSGLVLCSEDRKADGIVQGRSVEENINISSRRHYSNLGILKPAKEAETAEQYIKKLRVRTPSRLQDIVNLSGGNQQKVIIGRWLSEQGVRVLIADEPTRGIDVGAKSEIYDILYGLAEDGLAIVVVSSELPEVMGICDRAFVMCGGIIRSEFERAQFKEKDFLSAALPDKQAVIAS